MTKTPDRTVKWTPDLTQTIETLRTFRLYIDQQRIVKDVRYILDVIYETTLELDSHADTCVLGCGALIILDYNRPVSIVGYDESLGSKTYQTVSGVVAYDDPQTLKRVSPLNCHVDGQTGRSVHRLSITEISEF